MRYYLSGYDLFQADVGSRLSCIRPSISTVCNVRVNYISRPYGRAHSCDVLCRGFDPFKVRKRQRVGVLAALLAPWRVRRFSVGSSPVPTAWRVPLPSCAVACAVASTPQGVKRRRVAVRGAAWSARDFAALLALWRVRASRLARCLSRRLGAFLWRPVRSPWCRSSHRADGAPFDAVDPLLHFCYNVSRARGGRVTAL